MKDDLHYVDECRTAVIEAADVRTRSVRAEIKKLMDASGGLDIPEAHSILKLLVSAFCVGRVLSNSERGIDAVDYLQSAVHVLEAE